MDELGKLLVFFGGLILLIGLLMMLGGRLHVPFGHLPGDIIYRGKHTTFYFPVVTSIVVSIVLSVVFYFIGRFNR
ncbi:MAG: DUF2905 family protein [Terriglobales bacterium]